MNDAAAHVVLAHVHDTDLLVAAEVVLKQQIDVRFRDVESVSGRCAGSLAGCEYRRSGSVRMQC